MDIFRTCALTENTKCGRGKNRICGRGLAMLNPYSADKALRAIWVT